METLLSIVGKNWLQFCITYVKFHTDFCFEKKNIGMWDSDEFMWLKNRENVMIFQLQQIMRYRVAKLKNKKRVGWKINFYNSLSF